MTVQSLVIQTEAWAREELAAQGRLLAVLEAQERAIAANDTQALVESGAAVQAELATGPTRERRRRALTQALAAQWAVPKDALTLGVIAERAASDGIDTAALRKLRGELRDVSARVLRRGRRIAALARYHQGFLNELLQLLDRNAEGNRGATLVDATA